jgi:hypothetical protein
MATNPKWNFILSIMTDGEFFANTSRKATPRILCTQNGHLATDSWPLNLLLNGIVLSI